MSDNSKRPEGLDEPVRRQRTKRASLQAKQDAAASGASAAPRPGESVDTERTSATAEPVAEQSVVVDDQPAARQLAPEDHELSERAVKRKNSLAHRLYTGDISYTFVQHWKRWFAISAVLLLAALLGLLLRGLNLGIDFKGGAQFQAPTTVTAQTIDDFRTAVTDTKLPDMDSTVVHTVGGNNVQVDTRALNGDEVTTVRTAIAKAADTTNDKVNYSLIGASWGKEITGKAVQALAVFLVLVALLIWVYFRDWKMSIAALAALLHDLVLTVGIYALVGFTVTPATLIGVLTIMGYSLYDTVVVFDKVKENVRDLRKGRRSYSEAANAAVNQTLVRSINTTLIGVLPVAAILFAGTVILGTGPLEDLGLALFVGMITGAYSSIFIATPLLALLKEREKGMRDHRHSLERKAGAEERRAQRTTRTRPAQA